MTELKKLAEMESRKDLYTKAAFDFANALHYCYNNSSAPYIALFEGDVLFADGWLARSKLALQEIVAQTADNQWLDMRLFNDEKNVGFASNHLFGNGVPIIILGISTFLFGALRAVRRFTKRGKEFLGNTFIFVICGITVPLFVILFFQAGKSSMLPPTPGVAVQTWGCCSQAITMSRDRAPGLAAELVNKAGTQPDMLIKYFAIDNGLKRFVLNPVQVQHMGTLSFLFSATNNQLLTSTFPGFKSLLTPDRSQASSVWSVAFENLDPQLLKKDHKQMVQELYGNGFL